MTAPRCTRGAHSTSNDADAASTLRSQSSRAPPLLSSRSLQADRGRCRARPCGIAAACARAWRRWQATVAARSAGAVAEAIVSRGGEWRRLDGGRPGRCSTPYSATSSAAAFEPDTEFGGRLTSTRPARPTVRWTSAAAAAAALCERDDRVHQQLGERLRVVDDGAAACAAPSVNARACAVSSNEGARRATLAPAASSCTSPPARSRPGADVRRWIDDDASAGVSRRSSRAALAAGGVGERDCHGTSARAPTGAGTAADERRRQRWRRPGEGSGRRAEAGEDGTGRPTGGRRATRGEPGGARAGGPKGAAHARAAPKKHVAAPPSPWRDGAVARGGAGHRALPRALSRSSSAAPVRARAAPPRHRARRRRPRARHARDAAVRPAEVPRARGSSRRPPRRRGAPPPPAAAPRRPPCTARARSTARRRCAPCASATAPTTLRPR